MGTCLPGNSAVQNEIRHPGQGGGGSTSQSDYTCPPPLDSGCQSGYLGCLAAVGDCQQGIISSDDSHVSVKPFHRMDKYGGGTGTGKGGCNLASHNPRFSHAGNDRLAAQGVEQFHTVIESLIQPVSYRPNTFDLYLQYLPGYFHRSNGGIIDSD